MKTKSILIVACIGMMFAACSSRDDFSAANDDTIKLRATVAAPTVGTRIGADDSGIINDALPNGETVRVHFLETGTSNSIAGDDEGILYTTGDNGVLTTSETEPTWGSSNLNIYAYYPSVIMHGEGASIGSQQTIDLYKAYDVLAAAHKNVAKTSGPVTLQFKHAMSKIVVLLSNGSSGLDVSNAKNIKLYALNEYDIFFDVNNIPYAQGNTGFAPININLGDYDINGVTGVIPVQEVPRGNNPFISFTINGVEYSFKPSPSIELKSGYQYTFTLTIDNSTVKVKNFTVSPWETTAPECTQGGNAIY